MKVKKKEQDSRLKVDGTKIVAISYQAGKP
jgi:hypothetical protein